MRMYDLIMKKRKGEELTKEEINFFVEGFTNGSIPDYQASAMLMAIFFNKMNKRETAELTNAMVESGDKTSICLTPLVARPAPSSMAISPKASALILVI